jgi:D-serine deaminase-like pyridoxal phosphate-dependent protein
MTENDRMAASIVDQAHERVRDIYGSEIGRARDDLVTPALILDLDLLRGNLAFMRERLNAIPMKLRAHVKVHKSPHIARMQIEYGAIGVGCATVWEAIVMARAGIPDVFVVNEVLGPEKTRALALLAREAPAKVAVDDLSNVDELSRAAVAAGSTIGVLVDIDEGMRRCGVGTAEEALALARRISEAPGLRFLGVTGYEGHCFLEPDRDRRHELAREAIEILTGIADDLAANGLPSEIVSAGGTATWEVSSGHPGLTEIQPGSYATMDGEHQAMEPRFARATTVLSTCVSRRPDHIVLDAGGKTVGATRATIKGHELPEYRFDEEHSIFDADLDYPIRVGDRVELLCEYTPFAVSYFDAYHVVEGGRVVDVWPIMPRGPESRWLLGVLERGD